MMTSKSPDCATGGVGDMSAALLSLTMIPHKVLGVVLPTGKANLPGPRVEAAYLQPD